MCSITDLTADEAWDNLHSIIFKTVNKYAPLKEGVQAQNVPWIDDNVFNSMRLRDGLY